MKLKNIQSMLLIMLLLVPWLVFAANDEFARQEQMQLRKTMGQPNATLLNVNKMAHWIRSNGISAHDPNTNGSGVYFPRGVGAGVIYTDGLVWGGFVNDGELPAKRVGGTTYPTGLQPGKIISKGTAEDPGAPDVRVWRVRVDFATADLAQDAAELQTTSTGNISEADIADVRAQYKTDWMDWPADKGAPYADRDGSGAYEPDPNGNGVVGELVTEAGDTTYIEDIPGYPGADQTIWFAANDLNPGLTASLYGSPPIGVEVQTTFWGYNRTDALGNVTFKRYRFIYKGTANTPSNATIDSMFVAQWSDPDLGEYSDDFVGSDVDQSLSFVYNSTTVDPLFDQAGFPPPAAGYDFLQGPIVPSPGDQAIFKGKVIEDYKNLPMTAFNYFAAGSAITDPDLQQYSGTEQWYNMMNGFLPRSDPPEPFTDADGNPTKFTLSGDPVTGEGDIDGNVLPPGDRRMQMISGPFSMALGDTNEVVTALISGLGADRLSSISVLRYNDIAAQSAYDNFFELPKAPAAPKAQITSMDNKVVINWGADPAAVEATEGQDEKGYTFEGYNLLQLPGPNATREQAVKIATYDVVNEVTTILDKRFDVESGQILEVPVQLGTNSGIKRSAVITKDQFTGTPLINGTRYYFAVTAYNFNPSDDVPTRSLESSMNIIEVIPKSPDPGVRYNAEVGETFTATNQNTENPSDGSVEIEVVDPTKITGDEYKVTFDASRQWYLINNTTGDTLLMNQTNQSGDENYLIIDGLQVKVKGPDPDFKGIVHLTDDTDSSGEPFGGNNVWHSLSGSIPGYGTFYASAGGGTGSLDRLKRYIEYATPRDFELRFTDDGGYGVFAFEDDKIATVPFELWDIGVNTPDDPSDDKRMIPFLLSNAGTGSQWGWATGADPAFGLPASDWIYWMDPYESSPGSASYDDFEAAALGAGGAGGTYPYDGSVDHWGYYIDRHGGFVYPIGRLILGAYSDTENPPPSGTTIRFITTKPNTADDEFVFNSSEIAPTMSDELAKEDVEQINVFPNPYYGFNPQETDLLERFVTFNHLPQKATIRIFDLAGTLVRRLEKDDESQFLQWDLANHNELPVASGIYIAYIEMPDLDENKILKLAIIREQEYLLRY